MSSEAEGSSFSFVEAEHKVLKYWDENKIFKKSLENTADAAPYIFYDGPPFATGLPHHGHLVGGTLKDIIPRYFTMKGRYVERRFGWDCHGLPVENEIDKKLGMSALEAVEKLGVGGYNDECRGIVSRYTKEWEKTVTRMGRWVDFENDYKTMDPTFMESVWWVFKTLWDKDLIYKGKKVVPFSTALHTTLSNFEAALNYKDITDQAVTVLFKARGEDAYFAAWTTTPWTLPSNLCLCAGADIDYVLVSDPDVDLPYYLAAARMDYYGKKKELKVLKELKGSDLLGNKFEPLLPYFGELEKEGCFQVLNDGYVTTESGTGIVHIAPGFGEDDFRVMSEAGIKSIVCPVNNLGKFTSEVDDLVDVYVKDADKEIIKRLKSEGKFLEQSSYNHSYPFCYRTDTPLIYKAVPSWYVKVEQIRDKMVKNNQQVNWVPNHLKDGRFGNWLAGARDWSISRTRVWGNPLPVWINDVNEKAICVGSTSELKELSGQCPADLHRENVDGITFTIDGEEGTYHRVPDVLDCWFESGSMPYAQLHYPFENKEVFEGGFPAEFIAEGLDQTRGWFYTLNVLSTALFDKPAFKNVIVNGMILAGDGKKMSKSLRNYTAPDDLMEEYGADALRLTLITSGLVKAEDMRFTDDGVRDMVRRALLPWFNAFKFFQTYAEVDGWNPKDHFKQGDNILDSWLISRLQSLVQTVDEQMEAYQLYNVIPALFSFIEDLTNWYIRLNRRRFWEEGLSDDKQIAYSALYQTLLTLSKLMAPLAPFLSEHIFLELKKMGAISEESVHLCRYPASDSSVINSVLEDAVDRMIQVLLLGRQKRISVKIKVKTPLSKLVVIHKEQKILDEIKKLERYIKTELNVKDVSYSLNEDQFITLFAKPNSPVLGKKMGKKFGLVRKEIEALPSTTLAQIEAGESVEICDEKMGASEILIFREAKEGTGAMSNRFISIELDCTLTDELVLEGLAREVVNRVQKTRKEKGFNVSDRIKLEFSGDEKIVKAINGYSDYIKGETLCDSMTDHPGVSGESFTVDGLDLTLKIERV
ncbi:MAG: isoleucine--tRNA ligase [Bacteriovoracaceae bacterium]|jgi:isoleucyl-tRNA synthetase|nr:isoleucine--tRNA ligase [Bacteriovoracaceae bacterium]